MLINQLITKYTSKEEQPSRYFCYLVIGFMENAYRHGKL